MSRAKSGLDPFILYTDEALESAIKTREGTPLGSRRVDPCDIGESKQFFTTSPMGEAWVVRPQ